MTNGYAAGNYTIRCHKCGKHKTGMDKRAITCKECARPNTVEMRLGDYVFSVHPDTVSGMVQKEIAELKAIRAGWQPIETAPRDGTWVLLCGGRTDDEYGGLSETCKSQPVVAKWVDDDGGHYSPDVVPWWNWRFAWYDSGWHGIYEDPTHWMPLPDPPADHE